LLFDRASSLRGSGLFALGEEPEHCRKGALQTLLARAARSAVVPMMDRAWNPSGSLSNTWRWRYRDPKTGRVCTTLSRSTAEARGLQEAERIPGSMLMREVEADDFPETGLTSIPSVQSRKPTR